LILFKVCDILFDKINDFEVVILHLKNGGDTMNIANFIETTLNILLSFSPIIFCLYIRKK
jgi:hypothetical protein